MTRNMLEEIRYEKDNQMKQIYKNQKLMKYIRQKKQQYLIGQITKKWEKKLVDTDTELEHDTVQDNENLENITKKILLLQYLKLNDKQWVDSQQIGTSY